MRRSALPLLLALAACGTGYREPEDSEPMRRRIEDRNIASRVRMALARDPETAPYRSIRVRCEKRVVTLEGEVDRRKAKRRARELAAAADGVREVKDLIVASD